MQKDVAEAVARHLVAAGTLVDEDPEAALAHARYARRRASRIAVVREAAGITAYHAGEWAEALAELRAARRMGGGPGHLAVMADIERAMGRPERAIELSRSPEARELDRNAQIELAIVVAGARRDLDEIDAAVVALQVPELEASRRDPWSARLFYAYADNLLAAGRESDALQWFVHAADADTDGETDADARIADLTGEPLADDGIEFAVDETPGEAPAAEDSPADNAAVPTDHTVEDADAPSDKAAEVATDKTADESAEAVTDEASDKSVGPAAHAAMDDPAVKSADQVPGADDADPVAVQPTAAATHDPAAQAADLTAVDVTDGAAVQPAAVATAAATHDPAAQAADLTAVDVADGAAVQPAAVATDDTAGDLTGAEADGETDGTADRLAGPAAAGSQDDAAGSPGDHAEHATDDVADHTAGTAAEVATDDVTTEPNGPAAGAADDLAEERTVGEMSGPAEPAAGAADSAPVSVSSAADHAVEERDDTEAGEAEDRPDPAPVTNGHVDAAESGSTPSNGAARSDAAAVAARGEADPR